MDRLSTVLAIPPFVGRGNELGALGRALPGIHGENGRFVAVAGDPGMGKTRLMAEMAAIAKAQGNRVLWSQMIEDPGAPPYFSWMLALRNSLRETDDETLLFDLGSSASDVADIVPELRDRLGLPACRAPADSSSARFQLFDSVTRYLQSAAKRQPHVLLFDNLHLADRSTLALLEYFCQQIAGHPILVVGAYRDSELDRRHPLRQVLTHLARSADFAQIILRGLSRVEVAELLHGYLGRPLPAPLVDSVHEQSGGNPLFVTEIGNILARRLPEDQLPGAGFHFKVPASLSDLIAVRLDTLPTNTCQLLSAAAVLGREFDVALLSKITESTVERIGDLLQPAEKAGVIISHGPGHYRFHHVLFREVLYAEHSTVSKVLMHRRAGEELERRYRDDLQLHSSQLAFHFFEAAQAGGEQKAVNYCRLAAEDAIARRAYGEAAALFERATQVVELEDKPDYGVRYNLLLLMGQAQYQSGQTTAATSTLLKAVVLAYRQKWKKRLVDALFAFQHSCQMSGLRHIAAVPLHAAALERVPPESTALRARLYASQAKALRLAGEPLRARESFKKSLSLARRCGDQTVMIDCLRKGIWTIGRDPSTLREGLAISREALELARIRGPFEAVLDANLDIVYQLCDLGEIDEIQKQLPVIRALASKERQPHFLNVLVGFETAIAILQGRWSDAMHHARQAVRQVPLQGVLGLEGRFAFQIFATKKAQGTLCDVAELAARIISAGRNTPLWLPGQILLHCELGQRQQARDALDQLGNLNDLPRDDLYGTGLVYLTEACAALRDTPRCEKLYEMLTPYRGLNATLPGALMLGAVSGFLGLLAVATRRFQDGRTLFDEAIAMNEAMAAAPALAVNYVEYARLLLRGDNETDHVRARQMLGSARSIAVRFQLEPVLMAITNLANGAGADSLTDREIDVLNLIATGSSNQGIAESLHISHSTVATHVRNIFKKTGAANRTEAADFARRADLLGQV